MNNEVRPAPVAPDEEEPFWTGWVDSAKETANEFGVGYDSVRARIEYDCSCVRGSSVLGVLRRPENSIPTVRSCAVLIPAILLLIALVPIPLLL